MSIEKESTTQQEIRLYKPQKRVRWYQLSGIRITGKVVAVVFFGYLASLGFAIQGIQSVTQISFDPEVGELLDRHLQNIKQIHNLKQETYSARLARVIPLAYRTGEAPIQKSMIKEWLNQIKLGEYVPLKKVIITEFKKEEKKDLPRRAIAWVNSSTIKIWSFKIELPKEIIKQNYQNAEELVLRYQGIKANWEDEIQPSLVLLQVSIVIGTMFLIGITIIFFISRFKRHIDDLVAGFAEWSERDSNYRFDDSWSEEFGVITSHFNLMADEVDENRNRRLYMEKVASWQIIARKLAHEIKNPLTPIQMMVTQLVRRYKGDDAEFTKLLEESKNIITEEVSSLRRMVDNFSEFAQLPEPKLERSDVSETVKHVIDLERAGYPSININYQFTESLHALFDKDLIKQVLINLIKNAAEAGSTIINVNLENTGRWISVTIRDNGPGIPAELQNRIFEAYFTTKHTGPSPGMGLGLAVCQKVMLEHGGDLRLSSKPGETIFLMLIPIT